MASRKGMFDWRQSAVSPDKHKKDCGRRHVDFAFIFAESTGNIMVIESVTSYCECIVLFKCFEAIKVSLTKVLLFR